MKFTYSDHLVGLVARVESANTRLAALDPDRRASLARLSRRRAAALSARLDGSPLGDGTVVEVDGGNVPVLGGIPEGAGSGWARAARLESMEVQQMAAIEYANLLDVARVEAALAESFFGDPREALVMLHGHICQGLVARDLIGSPRRTDQAVHDGAHGKMIYAAPRPEEARALVAELVEWLRTPTLTVHPAIVAGVVHERVLQAQPFEAGNGRVARAAARLVLIARGVDPSGAAVIEEELMADAGGYYGEVAATMRRADDLSAWLERHTGALARALERAVDHLDPRPGPAVPERGRPLINNLLPDATVNVRTYATDAGVDLRTALDDLNAWARAGELAEVPAGAGLIFRRVRPPGVASN